MKTIHIIASAVARRSRLKPLLQGTGRREPRVAKERS